jgi:hypothetical protein
MVILIYHRHNAIELPNNCKHLKLRILIFIIARLAEAVMAKDCPEAQATTAWKGNHPNENIIYNSTLMTSQESLTLWLPQKKKKIAE